MFLHVARFASGVCCIPQGHITSRFFLSKASRSCHDRYNSHEVATKHDSNRIGWGFCQVRCVSSMRHNPHKMFFYETYCAPRCESGPLKFILHHVSLFPTFSGVEVISTTCLRVFTTRTHRDLVSSFRPPTFRARLAPHNPAKVDDTSTRPRVPPLSPPIDDTVLYPQTV